MPEITAVAFNALHPIGTVVRYWPGVREGAGSIGPTRTKAWEICGHAGVSVEGHPSWIALTHIEPVTGVAGLEVGR